MLISDIFGYPQKQRSHLIIFLPAFVFVTWSLGDSNCYVAILPLSWGRTGVVWKDIFFYDADTEAVTTMLTQLEKSGLTLMLHVCT